MVNLRIGCSGFYNRHWKEVFYPKGLRQKDWFLHYSRQFNSLELNTTFYKFPSAQTFAKWYDDSPPSFLFSVKAPRLITHYKRLAGCEDLVAEFYTACILGLEEKLGCLLFQFPPTFYYLPERLDKIISLLKPGYRNVVEFRHSTWWNQHVYDMLRNQQITFCSPDHPQMPKDFIVNNDMAYIRLHGDPILFHSNYDEVYLNHLLAHINLHPELKEVFIYFNNTASTAGVLNAVRLKSMTDPHDNDIPI